MKKIEVTDELRGMGMALRHDLVTLDESPTLAAWSVIAPLDWPVRTPTFEAVIIGTGYGDDTDDSRIGDVVRLNLYAARIALGEIRG